MRVIAGEAKGHRLKFPKDPATRPTSDKVREAIFDMLAGTFVDEPVLDLFAGTGAMGIEALSRGAASATFVERRPPMCQIIRENLARTHLADRARVLCLPVERALRTIEDVYGLILLDPPYAYGGLHDIMAMVGGARAIGDTTTVVFEHSPRFAVHERYARLRLHRQRTYGDTAVSIFVVQEGE